MIKTDVYLKLTASNNQQIIIKTDVYPGVDGELQVLGARDNGGRLEAGVGVGDHVHDGRI